MLVLGFFLVATIFLLIWHSFAGVSWHTLIEEEKEEIGRKLKRGKITKEQALERQQELKDEIEKREKLYESHREEIRRLKENGEWERRQDPRNFKIFLYGVLVFMLSIICYAIYRLLDYSY